MTCRHDPKHTQKSQTGAPRAHKAAAKGSYMIEVGGRYVSVYRRTGVRRELCCSPSKAAGGTTRKEGWKEENTLK